MARFAVYNQITDEFEHETENLSDAIKYAREIGWPVPARGIYVKGNDGMWVAMLR